MVGVSRMISSISKKIIKPLSPTPSTQRWHKLSLLDQAVNPVYVPLVFFYPNHQVATIPNGPKQVSELVTKSLSRTLTYYYPWAGSQKDNATFECDDKGAEFYEVEISSPMDKVVRHPDSNVKDLTFPQGVPWVGCANGASTVAQLSHFDCGGIALSVCLSHKVGDGCSVYYFLRDWAALTRNYPNTREEVAPYFTQDSRIPSPPEGPLASPALEWPEDLLGSCIQKRFVFSPSKITSLKALVAQSGLVQNPTRNEVLNALLYKCVALANTKPSQLVQFANFRDTISPSLPQTSIGNIVTDFSTPVYTDQRDLELSKLVADIRKAKQNLSSRNHVEQNELIDARGGDEEETYLQRNCDVYFSSSTSMYEFEKLDFGWGKPTGGSLATGPFSNMFFLMNTPDGGIEATVNLNEQDMCLFQNNKDLLQFATPIDQQYD